jgi:hypothetical protein
MANDKLTNEEVAQVRALLGALGGVFGNAEAPAAAEEAPAGDDLDGMSRDELKGVNNNEELGVSVTKAMDDDALRTAIREARAANGGEAAAEPEAEPEADPLEAAREALKAVITKKGNDAAKKLLTQFKVAKVSALKPADVAKFTAAAVKAAK